MPAFTSAQSAHHYRFVGIEVTTTHTLRTGGELYNLFELGTGSETSTSLLPSYFTFDRCYIHGNSQGNIIRGICLNGQYMAAVDSYFSDFHSTNNDAQSIAFWTGWGPFKVVNNHMEGTGENMLVGGSDIPIVNLVPSDIEFRNNHCIKPLSLKPGEPEYAGIDWFVKNLFELKNAQRVLVEGNIFENNWEDGQDGTGILFTPCNQDGGNPWVTVRDVTFRKNIIRHSGGGIAILGQWWIAPGSQQAQRILIENNIIEDIGGARWVGTGRAYQITGSTLGATDIIIDHNTAFQTGAVIVADEPTHTSCIFRNNINPHNEYGVMGSGYATGNASLAHFFPGIEFTKNILQGGSSSNYSNYPGNYFPAAMSNVGFVNYNNGNGGDYHLLSSSPYKNAGTDGKDLGADIDAVNAATVNTISGNGGGSSTATPTATPTPVPGGSVWFQNFEAGNGFSAGTGATTTLSTDNGANAPGTKSVNLTTSTEGDPGTTAQCVKITPQSGASINASGYSQLLFYIKDTQGPNTIKITLVDTSNALWSGWIGPVVQNQWTKINLAMSTVTGINKASIKEIIIGEWNTGTYYIDDVYFAQNATDPVPTFAAAPTTLIDENFNSGTTGAAPAGWTLSAPTNTSVTVAAIPSTSDKSMKIYDNTTSSRATAKKSFTPQTGQVTFEWKFMEPVASKWPRFLIQNGSTIAINLYDHEWGQLAYLDGSTGFNTDILSIVSNTWYTVKVVADPATDLFDIYVDGILKRSGCHFTNDVSSLDNIMFVSDTGTSNSTLYVDNLKVTGQ